MSESAIRSILIQKWTKPFNRPAEFVRFTGVREVEELTNDVEHTSHAFLLTCLVDPQLRVEMVWRAN